MRPRVPRWAQGVIGVIAFIILAQLIGLAIPVSVLPRISTVLDQAARLITNGRFLADLAATIEAWALGLLLATVIAVPLGLILDIGAGYVVGRINGAGIGAFIADASSGTANMPLILAATLWAGILGLVLNGVLLLAERLILPWHQASLDVAAEAEVAV